MMRRIAEYGVLVAALICGHASAADNSGDFKANLIDGLIPPNIPAVAIAADVVRVHAAELDPRGLRTESVTTQEACSRIGSDLLNPANWSIQRADGSKVDVIDHIVRIGPCEDKKYQAILKRGSVKLKPKTEQQGAKPDPHSIHEGEEGLKVVITMPANAGKPRPYESNALGKVPTPLQPYPYTLTLDPKQANDQKLLDGTKKDVFQLGLKLDVPAIGFLSMPGTRTYLMTDNVLSTESKDLRSKIDVKVGIEKLLAHSWYVPGFVEAQYLANQSFSNTSFVATAGIKTIIPWAWADPVLSNGFIRAPYSPLFTVGVQYENRIKRDPLVTDSHVKENLARLAGGIEWSPIYLFAGDAATLDELKDKMSLAIKLKGWYFPDDDATGGAKVRKAETYSDISLYVPLTGLGRVLVGSAPAPRTKLKLQYERGANEANGFARSESFKLGVEVATQ